MTTIYKLTRCLSGECELIHLSTDRQHLADLMRADIDKWTVPVSYTIEITLAFDGLSQHGRVEAFREAAVLVDREADRFTVGTTAHIALRRASCKLFALMEEECSE